MKKVIALALMGAFCLTAGCKKEGPMEKAGKDLDKAGEKVEDAAKDLKKDMNK